MDVQGLQACEAGQVIWESSLHRINTASDLFLSSWTGICKLSPNNIAADGLHGMEWDRAFSKIHDVLPWKAKEAMHSYNFGLA